MSESTQWRLFIEHSLGAGADKPLPDWIPYLPKPGTFKHPSYGEISFDVAGNTSFVNNFKAGIYQARIPIDAEHQTKVSGAVGWITDMRMNDNGSADAKAEWTDRGNKMLQGGRFRYVSPEFYPTWTDPATDEVFTNVAVGLALTNRPYFKESHLRPLVATEDGIFTIDEERSDESTVVFFSIQAVPTEVEIDAVQSVREDNKMAESTKTGEAVDAKAFAEVQLRLTELQDALAGSEEKRVEAEAQAQQYRESLDTTNERLAKVEATNQAKRFTELADGHDGPRWTGAVSTHVKIMKALGEDSEEFTAYVDSQKTAAAAIQTSALFAEVGTDQPGNTKTALEKLNTMAEVLVSENGQLTFAQAFAEVLDRNPKLYDDYRKGA